MAIDAGIEQIKIRRDLAANFASVNPILGQGEFALALDTKELRAGDGATPYLSLSVLASEALASQVLDAIASASLATDAAGEAQTLAATAEAEASAAQTAATAAQAAASAAAASAAAAAAGSLNIGAASSDPNYNQVGGAGKFYVVVDPTAKALPDNLNPGANIKSATTSQVASDLANSATPIYSALVNALNDAGGAGGAVANQVSTAVAPALAAVTPSALGAHVGSTDAFGTSLDNRFPVGVSATKYIPSGTDLTTTDVSTYVQQAIDEAASTGGGSVWWPAKTLIAEVYLKTGAMIRGSGHGKSTIKAVAGSTNLGIIMLAQDVGYGPVTRTGVSDLAIAGNGNAGQWGMFLKSVPRGSSPFDHGLWYSDFSHIRISGTLGGGIWLLGGGVDSLGPMQFLTFTDVSVQLTSGTAPNWIGILCSGQVGQVTWSQCEASYRGTGYGKAALSIQNEMDQTQTLTGGNKGAYSMTFLGCTFQGANFGALVSGAKSISFISCWFEDGQNGIQASNSAYSVTLVACSFHDTGSNGLGTGVIAIALSNGEITLIDCEIAGAFDTTYNDASAGTGGVFTIGHSSGSHSLSPFRQYTAASTVSTGRQRSVSITGSTTINTFSSSLGHGEVLVVNALTDLNISGSAGNIRFPVGWGSGPLTFTAGSRTVFLYDKAGNTFQLLSTTSSPVFGQAFATLPTDGRGFYQLAPQSSNPAAPTTGARLFSAVNGSGKVELRVQFPTGSPIVIATEA